MAQNKPRTATIDRGKRLGLDYPDLGENVQQPKPEPPESIYPGAVRPCMVIFHPSVCTGRIKATSRGLKIVSAFPKQYANHCRRLAEQEAMD